jgi:hypothetical protein
MKISPGVTVVRKARRSDHALPGAILSIIAKMGRDSP